jgi:hypothetical protein
MVVIAVIGRHADSLDMSNIMKGKLCLALLFIAVTLAGCDRGGLQAQPGKEAILSPGQHVTIIGEDLTIKFIGVSHDSRCPRGVQCVWAGEAKCEVEITSAGATTTLTLTERGLTDKSSTEIPQGHVLTFHITPYPQPGKRVSPEQYRLHLTVTRAVSRTSIIGFILNNPSDFQGREVTIVGYYRGWDLLQEANMPPPVTRSDWVITDTTGAIYVSAASPAKVPEGLSPGSLHSVNTLLEGTGIVRLTQTGQPYIEAAIIRRLP